METSLDTRFTPSADAAVQAFPTLRRLGLGEEELTALRRKGYLVQDDRGHGHAGYWRLRFRFNGQTRTLYLGRDAQLAEQVRVELAVLQGERRRNRQIAQLTSETKKVLRAAKQRLEPVLNELGFHFHGNAMRKTRGDKR